MRICKIEGCENPHNAKGFCDKHYRKYLRYSDPLFCNNEKHGMTHTPIYQIWAKIKQRCYNKNHKEYHCYGGRGIIMCSEWLHSFVSFYQDMGLQPFNGSEIDREDNNGNYTPNNCRWVTHTENNRNKTTTKLTLENVIEIRNLYKKGNILQKELAIIYRVSNSSISHIINNRKWRI